MSTKVECYELAEKLGATIHDEGATIHLEAPAGQIVSIGQHEYVYGVVSGRAGVWRAMGKDLAQFEVNGFAECADRANGSCDWCVEVGA